ncbi:SPX domain-containing protein [Gautieria morchelliformis]|nr:SPX domain-containing protein [Gautieria morchelliformis]
MKFARYLEETRIPEWKRAYIDFKGLKKRVAAIRKAKQRAGTAYHSVQEPIRAHSYGSLDHSPNPSCPSPSIYHASPLRETELIEGHERGPRAPPTQLHQTQGEILPLRPKPSSSSDRARGNSSVPRLLDTLILRNTTRIPRQPELTLVALYASLEPLELSFFTYLDQQLDKVHAFYDEREDEATHKLAALKDQLRELAEHRRQFYEAQSSRIETWSVLPRALGEALGVSNGKNTNTHVTDLGNAMRIATPSRAQSRSHSPAGHFRDPADYHHAKLKLKRAFQEFYRSLELLNDYRVLNLTGFRKALKKYEKVTQSHAQDLYMREKHRFSLGGLQLVE